MIINELAFVLVALVAPLLSLWSEMSGQITPGEGVAKTPELLKLQVVKPQTIFSPKSATFRPPAPSPSHPTHASTTPSAPKSVIPS